MSQLWEIVAILYLEILYVVAITKNKVSSFFLF